MLLALFLAADGGGVTFSTIEHAGDRWHVVDVDPARARIRLNWRNAKGELPNTVEGLATEAPDGGFELWCNKVTFPHYYQGLFEAGLKALGAKEIDVSLLSHDADGATFRLRFR